MKIFRKAQSVVIDDILAEQTSDVDRNKEDAADAFVEKVIVKPGQQVEIVWKFER